MKLEELIKKERLFFDDAVPFDGHENRFLLKLNTRRKPNIPIIMRNIAAVIAFISFVTGLYFYIKYKTLEKEILTKNNIEFIETENYYQQLIKEKQTKIFKMSAKAIEDFNFIDELNEMDIEYFNLKKELIINPNNKQVINALIYHMQMQLEIMENIYFKMNNTNTYNL